MGKGDSYIAAVTGEVIRGKHLGHALGFPTANQLFAEGESIPAHGIYASVAEIDGRRYPAVSNVGTRPTVEGEGVNCETHVMDYTGDLYGRSIRVELVCYLREERKFPTVDALKARIEADALCAREYFLGHPIE